MIGAIIGDVIGSLYENQNTRTLDFPLFTRFSRFTDDTVLTVAIADAVMPLRTNSQALWQAISAGRLRPDVHRMDGKIITARLSELRQWVSHARESDRVCL
jgi:ADP-ribosylglycohydrolase